MGIPLNVLILEDRPADAELMLEELRKAGFSPHWRRVDTERDFLAALDTSLDVILADHSLPQYDSVHALNRLQERGLDVPFIIVSATIGEDLAVALMKQGAADYVLKDRMARLGQAVRQAVQQRGLRAEKRRVEQSLLDHEIWLRTVLDYSADGIVIAGSDGVIQYASPSVSRITGYGLEEYVAARLLSRVHPDDLAAAQRDFVQLQASPGATLTREFRSRHKDGSWHWIEVTATNLLKEPRVKGIVFNFRDISERKSAAESLRLFRTLLDRTNDVIEVIDPATGRFLDVNERACETHGYTREEFLQLTVLEVEETLTHWPPPALEKLQDKGGATIVEGLHRRKDGSTFPVEVNVNFIRLDRDYVVAVVRDNTDRKRAESKMHLQAAALKAAANGIVITDRHGDIVWANEAFARLTGYTFEEVRGKNPRVLKSGKQDPAYYANLWSTITAGRVWHGELINRRKDGNLYTEELTVTPIAADGGEITHFIAVKQDITARKQSEEALRESEQHFRSLFDNMLNGFAYCRMVFEDGCPRDFIYLGVNGVFEKLTGLKSVIRRRVSEVIPGICEADPQLFEILGRVARTGKPERFEIYLRSLKMWFAIGAYCPEQDHFVAVFDVITERKQAETALSKSEERFRRITTNMLDLVVQVNPEGMYEYVTPSTLTVLGYREEELLGNSFFPLIHPDDLERAVISFKVGLETGVPAAGEYRFRKANGEYVWLEVVGKRLVDDAGHLCGGLIACRDVTVRRQAQDEIHKLNAELEQKVHERTGQLEAANKELESFAYSVSHDLRAPLRGIDGFSQALLEDYSGKLDAVGQDYLRRVRAATQRMGRLIDDILQLSRLNRSAMNREQVDLSIIAQRVIAELQAADPDRHVEICLTPSLLANGDTRLLEVVLTNLIGNAWKFTSKTKCARIEVGATDKDGKCTFFVRDNGAGFDMANADRLFGAFQRLHTEAEFPGTGIGLATVQRIIRRHGGEVWAEGAVGRGATVFFTLRPLGSTNHA